MNTPKTTKKAGAQPENVRTYTARFTGRQLGAIGIFEPFETTVEARNEDEARLSLYDRFEHISNLSLCLMGHQTPAPEAPTLRNVIVYLEGGVVQDVTVPAGVEVTVIDQDEIECGENGTFTYEGEPEVNHSDKLAEAGERLKNAVSDLINEPRTLEIGHYAETALHNWQQALAAYEEAR